MRGHGAHMWMCVAIVIAGLVALLATGNALYVVPVTGCVLMMGAMMWMMRSDRPGS